MRDVDAEARQEATLKAKCPECETGCDACKDGYTDVSFASGEFYTLKCTSSECGFENGGRIVNDDLPPLSVSLGPMTCVICKEPATWFYLGEV